MRGEKRRKGRRTWEARFGMKRGMCSDSKGLSLTMLLEVKRGKRVLRPMFTSRASVEREGNNYKQL